MISGLKGLLRRAEISFAETFFVENAQMFLDIGERSNQLISDLREIQYFSVE